MSSPSPRSAGATRTLPGGVRQYAGAAALGLAVSLVLVFFFSPAWVAFRARVRVPELFSYTISVARGTSVSLQVADPFVTIEDPIHKIVRWRLLMPLVGHYLGMAPAAVLALAHVGCVLVLTMIVNIG